MNICLSCKSEAERLLCRKCARNPFLVERVRQVLADMNDLPSLKDTYSPKQAEIKDLNTASFWNNKFSQVSELEKQDGMTKDRIKTASSFLPKFAEKILDIGAGNGFAEELLSQKNIKIFGNDISSVSVKNLRNKFVGQFRKESIYEMEYPRESFDAIFALEVLEHIPPSKIFDLLKKIRELLRKDGFFIISVPTNEGLEKIKNNPSGHVRTYTKNLIGAELEIARFKVIKIKTLYAFKSMYSFKKILSKFIRNKWKPNDIVILAKKI